MVLLDELEKAHRDIWSILLQVMEEGMPTDSRGRKTDFRNTVLVMTSNLGSQRFVRGPGLGFSPGPEGGPDRPGAGGAGRRTEVLSPEFLNRLDAALVFHPLDHTSLVSITRQLLDQAGARLAELGVSLSAEEGAVELLARSGGDREYGARPLRRAVSLSGGGPRRRPGAAGCPGPRRHAPGLRLPRQGHSSPSFPEMNGNIAQFSLSFPFLLWYNAHKATPQHMHGPAGHQRGLPYSRLGRHRFMEDHRSSGILLAVSSLPGPYGIGSLGGPARRFVDFLAEAGQHYWQILPLVPPGTAPPPICPLRFCRQPLSHRPG